MQKREAVFQTVFKHWVQSRWRNGSAAFELKRTETDRFYIKNLAPHQRDSLSNAFNGTLYHKIADAGFSATPFDCFVLQSSLAYVVIAFGKRLTSFYLIPIYTWDKNTHGKTSVTEAEVKRWEDVECVLIPKSKR